MTEQIPIFKCIGDQYLDEQDSQLESTQGKRARVKKHGQNRNYPGYIQPNRIGKKQISVFVDEDVAVAFKEAARAKGMSVQTLIEEFVLRTVGEQPHNLFSISDRKKILEKSVTQYRGDREKDLGLT